MNTSYFEILESRDPAQVGQQIPVPGGKAPLVVGRSSECNIVVPATTVSRQHARITRSGPRYQIQDLSSANGTSVNGARISTATPIGDQDVIGFGSLVVRFVHQVSPSATLDAQPTIAMPPETETPPTIVHPPPADYESTDPTNPGEPPTDGTVAFPPPKPEPAPVDAGTIAVPPPKAKPVRREPKTVPRSRITSAAREATPSAATSTVQPTLVELLGIFGGSMLLVILVGAAVIWLTAT